MVVLSEHASAAQFRHFAALPAVNSAYLAQFFGTRGDIDIEHVTEAYHMSKAQLSETTGLPFTTLSKKDRAISPKAQVRMREMLEILARVQGWAGSDAQAMAWYRSQPIPALDDRTAEALVKSGDAGAVRDYLDHMALGGFA